MRAPAFWYRKAGVRAAVLAPLAAVYTAATRRRLRQGAWERMPVPVICVGNINAGGTGKTPTVIALLEILDQMGVTTHVVSRGHGGSLDGPVQVDERAHSAYQVGDEPLLISAFGPCWVAKDRAAGAKAAVAAGAELILLDDGLQNPSLRKDFEIAVVDAAVGFGNGRVIPAGPLREPLDDGLARAEVVLSIGDAAAQDSFSVDHPRWQARLEPLETGMDWTGRFIAFAGIGRPEKFFATLRSQEAEIVATHEFGDHEPYTDAILQRLLSEAKAKNAQLVSTEKDIVRMPPDFRREVVALPVRLRFSDPDQVRAKLTEILAVG